MALDQHRAPTEEEAEDAILSARFGDLDELRTFVDAFGADALANARDGRGNSALHMAAANGHVGAPSPLPSELLLIDSL
jgi:ankyrin repeat protein